MKLYLMFFLLLVLSIFLHEAQGIRLEKLRIPANNHQELITESSLRNQDDGSAMAATIKLSSGINRKLMIKRKASSISTTNNKKIYEIKESRSAPKFSRELVEKEDSVSTTLVRWKHGKSEVALERYPDVIDITGMDYSPAKRKPPIHN